MGIGSGIMPEDLKDYNNLSSEDQEQYRKDSAFSVHEMELEDQFNAGSIRITEEIAKQASWAIKTRIDATFDYTKARIERINKNKKLIENKLPGSVASRNIQNSETKNIYNSWVDNLFLSWINLQESVTVTDPGDTLEEFMYKSLDVKEFDHDPKFQQLFAMAKEGQAKDPIMSDVFKELFDDKAMGKSPFYIKKLDAIKGLIKNGLSNSGFRESLEKYIGDGVCSGLFCFKEEWGTNQKYRLKVKSKDKKSFTYDIEQEQHYKFIPVDTRNIIFRKDKIHDVIEIIKNKTYSDILYEVVDEKGVPKKNSNYDYDMVKKVEEELRKNAQKSRISDDDNEVNDLQASYDIDGDVLIFQGESIPLRLNNKTVKYLITTIYINDQYIPIGIKATPYFESQYHFFNMFFKDGDIAGYGIPEVLEELQQVIDDIQNLMLEIMRFSLYGIFAFDPDKVVSPEKLKKLSPGDGIELKNLQGLDVNSAIQWFNGNLAALNYALEYFRLIEDLMRRTSQRGPGAEKTAPNPSATEISIMTAELEKSVNRVILRGGIVFESMLKNMYKYIMLNAVETLTLKVKAYSLRHKIKKSELEIKENINEIMNETDRYVEFDITDLFIDDLDFKISGLDKSQKQAVEKQQAMQFINLLGANGYLAPVQNPDGSVGKKYIEDETGTKYEINEYKLLTDLARKMNVEDFFTRVRSVEAPIPAPGQVPPSTGVGLNAPTATPPQLSASPRAQDILGGVAQT